MTLRKQQNYFCSEHRILAKSIYSVLKKICVLNLTNSNVGIMLIHSMVVPIAYIYINFLIHPNRQYKIGQNMMKVAETTDSLLNEHRENCQIGLSYIECTALFDINYCHSLS